MTIRLTLALAVTLTGIAVVVTHQKRSEHLVAVSAPPAVLPRTALSRASRGERRLPLRVKHPHLRSTRNGNHLDWQALSECEASGNPRAVDPTGTYFGLYQFDLPTWRSVGGRGNPADASPAEQTFRARILYGQRGRAPWPVCGVRL